MRFEGNSRGISRTDYQQFADFLGLNRNKYSRDYVTNVAENQVAGNGGHSKNQPIGMVYGVKQDFACIYDPEVALENGTIFEELNKPFYPVGCKSKSGEGCL